MEGGRPCYESLDSTLENNDLHIIVSAFYFACLDGSNFLHAPLSKKKVMFMESIRHRLLRGIGACYITHSALFENRTASHGQASVGNEETI
jgi:hypothetical protein